jgi:hypothetical protein
MRAPTIVAALLVVAGCTPVRSFVYGPTPPTRPANAPGQIDGHPATVYSVPAEDPRGDVQLAIERLTDVHEPEGTLHKVRVVVVRMIVRNRDSRIWCIDGGAVGGVFDGARWQYPLRVYSEGQRLRTIVLDPGDTRSIDLYYELPSNAGKQLSLGIAWRIVTPDDVVLRSTTTAAR